MVRVAFLGDLIFGDQPTKFGFGFDSIHRPNDYSAIFQNVEQRLNSCDLVVANFEAVIKDYAKNASVGEWSMCCTNKITTPLKNANIKCVSLANNHTMDYGLKWFNNTQASLKEEGINPIGVKDNPFFRFSSEGINLFIVALSYLKVSTDDSIPYLLDPNQNQLEEIIQKKEKNENLIFIIHWGNEFIPSITAKQEPILDKLVNFGPKLIVGHHPHILQKAFWYNNIPVFPSVGNFVSDYWQARARESIILYANFHNSGITFTKDIVHINQDGCPQIIQQDEKISLQKFDGHTSSNSDINRERWRLRMEYLVMIISNFSRIKGKKRMAVWLFKRFIYVILNFRQEKKNPEIIYEKYKN